MCLKTKEGWDWIMNGGDTWNSMAEEEKEGKSEMQRQRKQSEGRDFMFWILVLEQ